MLFSVANGRLDQVRAFDERYSATLISTMSELKGAGSIYKSSTDAQPHTNCLAQTHTRTHHDIHNT